MVNSFAHADFRGNSENEIDITPTQIEIYNPGEFPENYTPEMFAKQRIKSMPRNKVILNTLYKSKDVEIFGSGFRKVYSFCEKSGNKTGYASANGGFSFIFYRDRNENVTTNVPEKRIPTDSSVYMLLKENPAQTRDELARQLGKTVRTIQRALDKLTAEGKIRRIGSNKKGYWEVF